MTNVEVAKKLKDFKRLLDEGIITQDEYDEQKRLLLGLPEEESQAKEDQSIDEDTSATKNDTAQLEIEQLKEKLEQEKDKNKELNQQLQLQKEIFKETQTTTDQIKQPELKSPPSKNVRIVKIILDLFAWVITVFLVFLAFGAFVNPKLIDKFDGVLLLLLVVMICPPLSKRLGKKFESVMKYKPYIILGIVLILIALIGIYH